jgi:uncharacterized membrane protein
VARASGHPLHPPLTDATIGIYTFATVAGFVEVVGITDATGAIGWWLALIVGLIVTVPTALAGFADWLTITWRSDAVVDGDVPHARDGHRDGLLRLAAIFGHGAYTHANVSAGAFVLTLVGFGFLTLGGWLGGAVVFVHGMRVLNLVKEPTSGRSRPVRTRKGDGRGA